LLEFGSKQALTTPYGSGDRANAGLELRLVPLIEQFRGQLKRTYNTPEGPRYDLDEVVDVLRSRFREFERHKRTPLRIMVERGTGRIVPADT